MIFVTKPMLPPFEEYTAYLQQIWDTNHLTNFGPLAQQLEEQLQQVLAAQYFCYVANGTLALQLALKALQKQGEVITTPFSYVATTSSIVWEGSTPVFVDIDPVTLTLNPDNLEASITPKTVAILATHVYGNPCDVERIHDIAAHYRLPVLYDGAHAFGVRYQGVPLSHYGDMTTYSFHATKIFHTIEGGGVVTQQEELAHRLSYLRNFGHDGPEAFQGLGINAKNSEFHAAMGLCNLQRVGQSIEKRKAITKAYDQLLAEIPGLYRPSIRPGTDYNYAYYPVIFHSENALLKAKTLLETNHIFPRRYFYPVLNQLPYLPYVAMPIAEDISRRILCLPIYETLPLEAVIRIADLLIATLRREAA